MMSICIYFENIYIEVNKYKEYIQLKYILCYNGYKK